MTSSMAPLHSLVDILRIQNRCHQKGGVTSRPRHLRCNLLLFLVRRHPRELWGWVVMGLMGPGWGQHILFSLFNVTCMVTQESFTLYKYCVFDSMTF
jgi:hypothetical protein